MESHRYFNSVFGTFALLYTLQPLEQVAHSIQNDFTAKERRQCRLRGDDIWQGRLGTIQL